MWDNARKIKFTYYEPDGTTTTETYSKGGSTGAFFGWSSKNDDSGRNWCIRCSKMFDEGVAKLKSHQQYFSTAIVTISVVSNLKSWFMSVIFVMTLLVCNFFGERTMYELRDSLFSTDEKLFNGAFMRLPINLKMVDISDLLGQVGFKELVSETISYKIYYKNIRKIFEDLKGIGENKILSNRKKSLMTNNYLNTLNNEYRKKFSCKYEKRNINYKL